MKIAIVDDSRPERQELINFIRRYTQQHNLTTKVSVFDSGEEFLREFTAGAFEVIFMDIYTRKLDGMETAIRLRKLDATCLLIFATATASYAVKSFRVRAFDYLMKPYTYEQFCEVMQLCEQSLGNQLHYIQIKENRTHRKILIKNIIYTDYHNHYIQIHTNAGLIRTYMFFADFSPLLTKYPQFLCCYRNCLVNMNYIDVMEDGDFLLKTGERLPINRQNNKKIRQAYADYIFDKEDD